MGENPTPRHGEMQILRWQRSSWEDTLAAMLRVALVIVLSALCPAFAQQMRVAPNGQAQVANQLVVAGNACGPAALLNAFRCGNENWQRPVQKLGGANDRERILAMIRQYGGRPSGSLKSHQRWSKRGINLADLTDIANEMAVNLYLPQITSEVFFAEKNESQTKLLQRTHKQLGKSLSKGLPPVLSLRRFAFRKGQWTVIEAHFVTLIALPEKLEKNATRFPIQYLDPWGGKRCQGEILVPPMQSPAGLPSNLQMNLPQTSVGRSLVKQGEPTVVVLSAAIGRW